MVVKWDPLRGIMEGLTGEGGDLTALIPKRKEKMSWEATFPGK